MTQGSDGRPGSDGKSDPEIDGDLSGRRERLNRELKRRSDLKAADDAGARNPRSDGAGLALALRVGSEFVAAVIAGGIIGWGADRLLGWSPWGMIAFLTLGFAAGVMNVMRTTGLAAGPNDRRGPGA